MNRKILFAFLFLIVATASNAQQIKKWSLNDLKSAIANVEGPTILNFWATFCKPCMAEMPHFQQMAAKYKAQGVKLVLVNLDAAEAYPKKIQAFIRNRKVTNPVVFLNETDADLFCPAVDESWSGAIPATLFINPKTGYRKFIEDEMTKKELEEQITKMLKK